MNKQTITKIISGLIISSFVLFVFPFSQTIEAATEASMSSLYSNPNQSGKNPYKFKVSDVVNSNLLTNIVGCTGVVNKVADWMSRFVQSPLKMKQQAEALAKKTVNQVKEACSMTKKGVEAAAGIIYGANDLTTTVDTSFEKWCATNVEAKNDDQIQIALDQQQAETANTYKEQCFDGIALTLARNQLTAMTRSAMNWVNTGYGGNPFFVQNMRNFTEGIERNVIETGIDVLLAPDGQQSPYAADFARATINSRGILSSSSGFLGGLQSNLQNFITDPSSYYSNKALERAQDANNAFSRSFMTGGWNGWLAFTQTPQNNPLGFNMLASQYLADMETQQVQEKKDELAQNNGFLSQKTCIKWQIYNAEGEPKTKNYTGLSSDTSGVSIKRPDGTLKSRAELESESRLQLATNSAEFEFSNSRPKFEEEDGINEYGKCVDWKITTPGSIIRDKTTNYLNSPERQLELAKTINDSLNALFSVLISKLQGGGLSGLSEKVENTTNWTDSLNDFTSADGNTPYDNNGAYDGFDLTRDLGNTYIHGDFTYLGTWNAKACLPGQENSTNCNMPTNKDGTKPSKLHADLGPGYYKDPNTKDEKFIPYPSDSYYTVTTAGNTKIMTEGYNGWAVGDRAFWDGSEWKNWKDGQTNPIEKRGVVQVQQDYIVAAKEIMKVLPAVMTNLGKLDFCLPGPNPSYKSNSTNAQSAYQDWIGSMYVGPRDEERVEWRIDHEDSRTYKNLASIFTNNPTTWQAVLNSSHMSLINEFDRNWLMTNNEHRTLAGKALTFIPIISAWRTLTGDKTLKIGDCAAGGGTPGNCQDYHYKPSSAGKEQSDIDDRKQLMEEVFEEVNNHLFQEFYKKFDEQMNKDYFKNMTDVYDDTEMDVGTIPNLSYIKMAESGFDLTKNITYYNDDIAKVTKEYNNAISQAKINIAKLEPIKSEVSGIIKAAQDRRKKTLGAFVNNPNYAACLAEENIQFYDADSITNMKDANAENCIDGVDNDLNGLIDKNDDKCPGYVAPSGSRNPGATGGSGYRR